MPGERVQRTSAPAPAPARTTVHVPAHTPLGPVRFDSFGSVPASSREEALNRLRLSLTADGSYSGFAKGSTTVTQEHRRPGKALADETNRAAMSAPEVKLVVTGKGGALARARAEAVRDMLVSFGVSAQRLRVATESVVGDEGWVRVTLDSSHLVPPLVPATPLPPGTPRLTVPPPAGAPGRGAPNVPTVAEPETGDSYAKAGQTVLKAALKLPDLAAQVKRLEESGKRRLGEITSTMTTEGWIAAGVVLGTMAGITVYGATQNDDLRGVILPKLTDLMIPLPSQALPPGVGLKVGMPGLDLTVDLGTAIPALRIPDPLRLRFDGSLRPGENGQWQVGFTLEINFDSPRATGAPR